MSMPFYVSPEQVMADKAEYARKGISRGKSSVTLEFEGGVVLMAENVSSLMKIGEIYDRVAFAGVGKFSEFDQLRKLGVRYADTKGYAYSREDVRAKGLANAYSQAIGDAFTQQLKPLEVELIVAEVGDPGLVGQEHNSIYRVTFDGSISDHEGYCVIGGAADDLDAFLRSEYRKSFSLRQALHLGRRALERAAEGQPQVAPENLEVCVLERGRIGRKFHRLSTDTVRDHLAG
ncbi:MAG: proteasome subunit alpha [Myxococcota bacterium]|jgi:proteasome alpha subunit|nr:proteasome subunit alpha [Deltaproteobacteria bacterium]MCP4241992.1 proteasome subunit alpha [bacterium]MDP6074998.1 proteasome subunit alpha [Myxococcota bacterium]MDP7076243.1 proteasome subunit alpha [Myxococcota bacterium]MDP7301265.1 proteasome subunit alpha [Myxococcota bacterium]